MSGYCKSGVLQDKCNIFVLCCFYKNSTEGGVTSAAGSVTPAGGITPARVKPQKIHLILKPTILQIHLKVNYTLQNMPVTEG